MPSGKLTGLVIGALVTLSGGGGAGYYLRGSPAGAAESPVERVSPERVSAIEKWQAAEIALRERDRSERAELVAAVHDLNITNSGVRDAVIALTERLGGHERRIQALESARHR
ncbi:MAG TPA: hypothetical protein VFT91_05685 [Dehalococcoidia bacterium]|nr:hypothetical protein [Dehalococcoidia bacterium]